MRQISNVRRQMAIGALGVAMVAVGCTPSSGPSFNPATCTRTQSAAFTVPSGKSATAIQLSGNGRFAVGQVNNGTGPAIPNLFGWSESFNVYRWDRLGAATPTQINPAGTTARFPVVSSDGRYVVYERVASSDYPPSHFVIDVVDTQTSTITQITNTTGPARSTDPAISDDGRFVAFLSDATNLVPGDPDLNSNMDVFVWDRTTGAISRVTDQSAGYFSLSGFLPHASLELSGDGSTVLVTRYDAGGHSFVQLIDRVTKVVTPVADVAPLPPLNPGDPSNTSLVLTADLSTQGTVAGFVTNGLPVGVNPPGGPDTNRGGDAFLFNRATSILTQATNPTATIPGETGVQTYPVAVSGDGRFLTLLTNLVDPADTVTSPPALSVDGRTVMFDRTTGVFTTVAPSWVSDQSTNAAVLVGQLPTSTSLYFWTC